jgi:hypothetical protein
MATTKVSAEVLELQARIATSVGAVSNELASKLPTWREARSPAQFRSMELEVAAVARDFADEVVEHVLRDILGDPEFVVSARRAARSGLGKLRNGGGRKVTVTLLGGREVRVVADYLRPDLRGRPGPRRARGRRGKGGAGVYPALAALGIHFGVTPALLGEVVRQVADSDSLRAGRSALSRRGIELEYKQTLRIVNAFGGRAVAQRDEWLVDILEDRAVGPGGLEGKRVVVAADGGRVRERVTRPGRRREESGHHGFDTPWCEPKLFTVYVINGKGKVDATFRPTYDGTLDDADTACTMLVGYLKALGAAKAKQLTILGDGAKWIWGRAGDIARMVGVPAARVTEIVDWYHAVEKLGEVADAHKSWSDAARKAWLKSAKKALHAGDIDGVTACLDEIAVGRRAKEVNKHRDYFIRNAERMQYANFKAAGLPIGSGAIESAIRMIVNMRLKGTGTFWLRENVQAMLMVRSYLKAYRFDDLVDWSITKAASWWQPGTAHAPGAPVAKAA